MVLTRRQSAAAATSSNDNSESTSLQPSANLNPDNMTDIQSLRQRIPHSTTDQQNMNDVQKLADSEVHPIADTSSTSSIESMPTSAPSTTDHEADAEIKEHKPKKKSASDFWKRAISGLFLTFLFVLLIRGGHMWVGIGVVIMEIGMFNEVLRLGFNVASRGRIPLWRTTGWYFFVSLIFLLYGKIVLTHFNDQGLSISKLRSFQYLLQHHSFISFCIYCAGFVGFVLSLRPDKYHFQFTYFGRALVALLLVVVQAHFMILNTTLGLIWFILPCWLIIVNDSFGYFCGRLFGKHSLTALSPKKTWEGYIGAGIFTMITAYFLSDALSSYQSLICPREHFDDCYFVCPPLQCDPIPNAFKEKTSSNLLKLLPLNYIHQNYQFHVTYKPVQLHAVALGAFAAIIAPFGGFFASGAKRAFGVKDFGGILPGHGGVTDRVDCQLMMAVFTYAYVINFVNNVGSPDVTRILSLVLDLTTQEQIDLMSQLYVRLQKRGVDGLLANLTNLTQR